MKSERGEAAAAPLRVGFVLGVTPDKWARTWAERVPHVPLVLSLVEEEQQTSVLYDGRADMCFVRLPVDQEGLHVIPLYSEVPVVVAPKGHFIEAADEVSVADLADEHLHRTSEQITAQQAIETVAAGVGIVIVPMSLARLHHRKDVVHRPVTDVEESRIGLAWRRHLDDDRVEAFIGVVRGRSVNSSRGVAAPPATRATSPKQSSGSGQRRGGQRRAVRRRRRRS